jgi:hypothetical protein
VGSGDGGSSFFHKQDTTLAYGTTQNGHIFKKANIHIPFPQPGYTNPVGIMNQLDANTDGNIDEGAYFIHPFWVNDADGEQLYFPTKRRLWRSTDGGDNWQPISGYYNLDFPGSTPITMEGNHKNNPIVYWTVQDTLLVMPNAKTAVAGNEFKIKLPGTLWSVRRDPTNDSIVYIVSRFGTDGARIQRSSNIFSGNVQWTDLTGDLPDDLWVRCFEINPDNKDQMIAGTSAGLYVSGDGGQHWEKELQFPSVSILRTSMRPSDKRLFIFTYGRGVWAASFPGINTLPDDPNQTVLAVWPNPAQDVLHVAVPEIHRNTSVQIWSMNGKLLRSVTDLQHTPAAISLAGLPPGNYMVTLNAGNTRLSTAHFIKL